MQTKTAVSNIVPKADFNGKEKPTQKNRPNTLVFPAPVR